MNNANLSTFKISDIFQGMPGGFLIYKASNEEIIYANDELIKLYECEDFKDFIEYTGGKFCGMVYTDDYDRITNEIEKQLKNNETNHDNVEYRIVTKSGEIKWVEDFGHLASTKEYGNVFYVFITDISFNLNDKLEAKRLIEENKRKQKILNDSLQSTVYAYKEVYLIHPYENYYSMIYPIMDDLNEKGDYKKGIENHFATGRIDKTHRKDIQNALQPENLIKALIEKNSVNYKYKRKNTDGVMEWCNTTITVQRRECGRPVCVIMGIRGIDELLVQEEIQKRELQMALTEAKKQSKLKTQFLSNISHDIRTPLNAILGYTQLAKDNIEDSKKISEYLQKISYSGDFLLKLINDVLDMSSIEAGNLSLNENKNSLKKILSNSISVVEVKLKEKNIDLNVNVSPVKTDLIYCDELRLSQIFVNIITNAIKFSNPGGKISISIDESNTPNPIIKSYEIRIKDNGAGMSKEFLNHVFEPFARERSAYSIPGTGLGLSIVKSLIDLMNGSVKVYSKKGVGTEFVLNLCFQMDESQLEVRDSIVEVDTSILNHNTALIIDDNPINIEIAVELLSTKGIKTVSFDNAIDGIEYLINNEKMIDFVLMDIRMPVMDGYEATAKIKKRLPNICVIGMSANAFKEDMKKGYAVGMDAYISKPILIESALQTIASVINKKQIN